MKIVLNFGNLSGLFYFYFQNAESKCLGFLIYQLHFYHHNYSAELFSSNCTLSFMPLLCKVAVKGKKERGKKGEEFQAFTQNISFSFKRKEGHKWPAFACCRSCSNTKISSGIPEQRKYRVHFTSFMHLPFAML